MDLSIGCKTVVKYCVVAIVHHLAIFNSSHEQNALFCDNNSIQFLVLRY